jgi:uncharacterized protein YbaP (TraB family)
MINLNLKIAFLFILFVLSNAHSQSIFKVYRNGTLKAVLVGSSHRDIFNNKKYIDKISLLINEKSYLLIEQDARDLEIFELLDQELRFKYFLNLSPSVNEISKSTDLSCLKEKIKKSSPDPAIQDMVMNLNPLYQFLMVASMAKFQLFQETKNYRKSTDEIISNIILSKNLKIYALEKRDDFLKIIYSIPIKEYAISVNNFCLFLKSTGSEEYKPLNPINDSTLNDVFNHGSEQSISKIRDDVIEEWLRMGLTKPAITQFLEARDIRNSKVIHAYLSKTDGVAIVLVGLLHIGGKNGLVSNLRNMGYIIKQ